MTDHQNKTKPVQTHRYYSRDYKVALFNTDMREQYGIGAVYNPKKYRYIIDDRVYYRVQIAKVIGIIEVVSLDMESVDDPINGSYDSLSDLPQWMQERIAMLSMLSFKPPTETVPGVGRRIGEFTYWVEKPDSCD